MSAAERERLALRLSYLRAHGCDGAADELEAEHEPVERECCGEYETGSGEHGGAVPSAASMGTVTPRSASYELGRARGYVTGRAEPTERDAEWWAAQPGVDGDDDFAYDDFGDGMLDGRDQSTSASIGLPCPAPPSPDALAAAREGSS